MNQKSPENGHENSKNEKGCIHGGAHTRAESQLYYYHRTDIQGSGTALVLPLLVKIKDSHTTLSPLMMHNPSLARALRLLIYTIPKDRNALSPTTDSTKT